MNKSTAYSMGWEAAKRWLAQDANNASADAFTVYMVAEDAAIKAGFEFAPGIEEDTPRIAFVTGFTYRASGGDNAREWHSVGDLGERQDGAGNSLEWGVIGRGYSVHTVVDGREVTFYAESLENANDTLAKLESGWRPVNWQG